EGGRIRDRFSHCAARAHVASQPARLCMTPDTSTRSSLLPIVGQAPGAGLPVVPVRPRPTPPLPMNRAEMVARGWDAVDVVFVTGDAYVDHPSFAMALLGRLLESEGFRVAILSQPDWHHCQD